MNAIVKAESTAPALRQGNARPLVPQSMDEMYRMATAIVRAGMQPKSFGEGPKAQAACFVAMQMGAEVGFPPMAAIQNIAVINGKPGVYGPAQMALVRASGLLEAIEEKFEGKEDTDEWTAVCTVKRVGQLPESATFSVADAKKAGLWGKQGPWAQYRKRMLRMRARGFALRDVFPDVLLGLTYTTEELEDQHIGPDNARVVATAPAAELPQRDKLSALEDFSTLDTGESAETGGEEVQDPPEPAPEPAPPADAAPPPAIKNTVLEGLIADIKDATTAETIDFILQSADGSIEHLNKPDRARLDNVVALRRRELGGKR